MKLNKIEANLLEEYCKAFVILTSEKGFRHNLNKSRFKDGVIVWTGTQGTLTFDFYGYLVMQFEIEYLLELCTIEESGEVSEYAEWYGEFHEFDAALFLANLQKIKQRSLKPKPKTAKKRNAGSKGTAGSNTTRDY